MTGHARGGWEGTALAERKASEMDMSVSSVGVNEREDDEPVYVLLIFRACP
jgi:hypothetical protein